MEQVTKLSIDCEWLALRDWLRGKAMLDHIDGNRFRWLLIRCLRGMKVSKAFNFCMATESL